MKAWGEAGAGWRGAKGRNWGTSIILSIIKNKFNKIIKLHVLRPEKTLDPGLTGTAGHSTGC